MTQPFQNEVYSIRKESALIFHGVLAVLRAKGLRIDPIEMVGKHKTDRAASPESLRWLMYHDYFQPRF